MAWLPDGHNKNSPDSGYVQNVHPDADSNLLEHKAFYENLPFHGMNNQGTNKVSVIRINSIS